MLHTVRRDLLADFSGAAESASRLTVDGETAESLAMLNVHASDGAIAAPVLLQHTLRYVLSTEPKQRADYFKALLTLTDLDLFRERVHRRLTSLQQQPPGAAHLGVEQLGRVGHSETPRVLQDLAGTPEQMRATAVAALLHAGAAVLPESPTSVEELIAQSEQSLQAGDDLAFPLSDLAPRPLPALPTRPDLQPLRTAMAKAADTVTALLPVFTAVLAVPDLDHLDHPVDCPVCASPAALTPARLDELRMRVLAGAGVSDAAEGAADAVRDTRTQLRGWIRTVQGVVPAAARWSSLQRTDVAASAADLIGDDLADLDSALTTADSLATRAEEIAGLARQVEQALDETQQGIARRENPEGFPIPAWQELEQQFAAYNLQEPQQAVFERLRSRIQPALRERRRPDGLEQLVAAARQLPQLLEEQQARHSREHVVRRLTRAEKAIKQAAGKVLDRRFASMSVAIERWWGTIRPDELVGFAGVKRRAAGAIFVNLMAALQPQERAEPVERDALGVGTAAGSVDSLV